MPAPDAASGWSSGSHFGELHDAAESPTMNDKRGQVGKLRPEQDIR